MQVSIEVKDFITAPTASSVVCNYVFSFLDDTLTFNPLLKKTPLVFDRFGENIPYIMEF